MKKEEPYMSLF